MNRARKEVWVFSMMFGMVLITAASIYLGWAPKPTAGAMLFYGMLAIIADDLLP